MRIWVTTQKAEIEYALRETNSEGKLIRDNDPEKYDKNPDSYGGFLARKAGHHF